MSVATSRAEFRTRIATAADAPRLVDVINRAYVAEAGIVRGLRISEPEVQAMLAAPNTWFLVVDAPDSQAAPQLSGCVRLDCDGRRGHIGLLSVHPDVQGRGLGGRLLREAELHCHNQMCCSVIELDVVNLRVELFGFYEHMGFVRTGVLPFPDEALLLQPAHLVTMQKPASRNSQL